MGQVVEALHRLQEVERQLAEIRRDREGKERRVAYQRRQVAKAEERLRQSQLIGRERQIRLDRLQLEIAAREEAITRHRQALNSAKTNKEYASILAAMNTEKADTAKIESEVLQLMEQVQTLNDERAVIEAERAKLMENVARAETAVEEFDKATREQLVALQSQREESASHIDPVTLSTFTRVAEHHDGEAMVPVVKLSPRRDEYICGGCNITVTLEIVNALQTRSDIQLCKTCGRILCLDSEFSKTRG